MDKELFILNQEQLDAFESWVEIRQKKLIDGDVNYYDWKETHPCPLPSPVKVLTEEEIEKRVDSINHEVYYTLDVETFRDGYNACLSDLGIK